jgi:hypothetical protein
MKLPIEEHEVEKPEPDSARDDELTRPSRNLIKKRQESDSQNAKEQNVYRKCKGSQCKQPGRTFRHQ